VFQSAQQKGALHYVFRDRRSPSSEQANTILVSFESPRQRFEISSVKFRSDSVFVPALFLNSSFWTPEPSNRHRESAETKSSVRPKSATAPHRE
jgi:hypothetical protein